MNGGTLEEGFVLSNDLIESISIDKNILIIFVQPTIYSGTFQKPFTLMVRTGLHMSSAMSSYEIKNISN
jgi:hypothetical protein